MARAIPATEFKEAIKALNGVLKKDGGKPIKVVGVKKEDVLKEFTDNILEFIENDKVETLPNNVIEFYNNHVATDDSGDEGDDAGAQKKEKTAAKGKGKKTSGAKGDKKPAKKKAEVEKDEYGNRVGTGAANINAMLAKGAKLDDIVEKLGTTKSRVNSHVKSLQAKGYKVENDKGVLSFA
jgi:hypothetical protein